MTAGQAARGRSGLRTSAALLLAVALVLSQTSEIAVARWSVRLLPVWAVLLVLALPPVVRGRLRVPVALTAFGAWSLASYSWSADPGESVRRLADLLALLLVGWLVGQLLGAGGTRRALARTVQVMLVVTAVSLLVAPGWATAPGADLAPGWHGPFSHKNGLGFFCAFAAVTLWTELPPGWARRGWLALVLVLLLGSHSASALAVLVVAAVVMTWHAGRRGRSASGRLRVDAAWTSVLGAVGALLLLRPALLFAALGRDSSLTGRVQIWAAVEHWIAGRPWTGYGFGGVWGPQSPVTQAIWIESRFDAFYAHNGYLDLLLQVGVVGLGLFACTLVGAVVAAARTGSAAGSWALGVLVLLVVTALTESGPFTGSGVFLVALLVGCLTARDDGLTGTPAASGPQRTAQAVPA